MENKTVIETLKEFGIETERELDAVLKKSVFSIGIMAARTLASCRLTLQEGENMSKKTVVISAYPCCGKTYAYEHYKDKYSMLDSDSSKFSWKTEKVALPGTQDGCKWEERKVRNPEFPDNYIAHIKENIGKVDIIFVSSHIQVRKALEEARIRYCTVYPKENMLNEWVGRMYRRGSDEKFIKFQIEHWNEFMHNIIFEPYGFGISRLGNNEFLDIDLLYLRWVEEQTPEICLAAVQQNGEVLEFIREQTIEICMAAVQQNPNAIKYICDPEMRQQVEETVQKKASDMSIFQLFFNESVYCGWLIFFLSI